MEPPGGLPPDRGDRQLVPVIQTVKPILTLNLPQQSSQLSTTAPPTSHAFSPAAASTSSAAAAAHHQAHPHSTSPALASTATAISATTQAATAFSGSSVGQQHVNQPHHSHHQIPATHSSQPPHQQPPPSTISLPPQPSQPHHGHNSSSSAASTSGSVSSSLLGGGGVVGGGGSSGTHQQPPIEKLSRPMAFDKMESLVREMQDPEHGVPVRQQKMFLTSIPYAFMGYDLIEWLMDRLFIEESEALNIANQLCLHGYFFPVNDTKTLTVKDDSSLYRFQTPYYWPWQHKAPDNVEYAIYLAKRSLRNKQRHALEDYEAEALTSLHKNLKGKWDFISMQAEEQVRLAKERKKGDKIVGDSQERAYWRVHRPPPGQFTPLEPCPIPSRDRLGLKPNKKKTVDDVQREVDYLKKSLNRTRMKMSQACESLTCYSETFVDYDFFLQPVLPSNPWVTEDVTFWQLNNIFVNTPTEKRVKRWAISIEELVSDPTGLQEFTSFLEKEYSHENIRFWIEVNRLRRSAHSQVVRKVNEIYEEFLKPGAPCEINIDGKTMESVLKGLKNPSRFTFDSASEHIYMLLLKKDCYPRFIRSDHYKRLLETGIQPSHKKRFFNFGGVSGAKKKMTAALSSQPGDGTGMSGKAGGNASSSGGMMQAPPPGNLARRRGSDRSLTGSAHELAVIGVNKDMGSKVPHSHSQSNLSEIPYSEAIYRGDMAQCQRVAITETGIYAVKEIRVLPMHVQQQEPPKPKTARLEPTLESAASAVCPWDVPDEPPSMQAPVPTQVQLSVCPWEQDAEPEPKPAALSAQVAGKGNSQRLTSTSSDITDMSDRMQRNLGIRHQNTVDSGEAGIKRLMPNFTEQRRASMSFTPNRISEYPFGKSAKTSSTPSPGGQHTTTSDSTKSLEPFASAFPPLFTPLQAQRVAVALATSMGAGVITKDPPSSSDAEIEEELNKLTISQRTSESSASEMSALPPPTPTPPPLTKITPPPPDDSGAAGGSAEARNVTRESSKTESPSVAETIDEDDEAEAEAAADEVTEATDEASMAAGGNAEVEAEIQDVQIELIETASGKGEGFSGPPSIQVDEPPPSSPAPPKSPAPKSHPRKLISNAAVEVDEPDVEADASGLTQATSNNNNRSRMSTPTISLERPDSCSADAEVAAISSMVPPPVPSVGPMEEEELELRRQQELQKQKQPRDSQSTDGNQEELSPTTDEYQEGLQFGDNKEDYEYDIVDAGEHMGYIPPAPTPAPSLAPLAELDADDETCDEPPAKSAEPPVATTSAAAPAAAATEPPTSSSNEELRKRRKKRNSDGKKMSSIEEKEKDKEPKPLAGEADRNAVCPWEDENVTTSDGTFVKTYATLGYL